MTEISFICILEAGRTFIIQMDGCEYTEVTIVICHFSQIIPSNKSKLLDLDYCPGEMNRNVDSKPTKRQL